MNNLSDAERAELFQRACSEFAHYFWVELGWEKWRAEWLKDPVSFKNKNSSCENAALLLGALDKISAYHPSIKEVIDRERRDEQYLNAKSTNGDNESNTANAEHS